MLKQRTDIKLGYMPQNYDEVLSKYTYVTEYIASRGNKQDITKAKLYLGNMRLKSIGLDPLYEGYNDNPAEWVDRQANANSVKTDFFEAKSTAYAKAATLIDDL